MNLGMILVLFILLVIVAQTFLGSSISSENDQPISALYTEGFDVVNETTNYRFILSSKSGSIEYPASSIINPRGGSNHFELQLSRPSNEASVTYTAYNLGNQVIGEVKFGFKCVYLLGVRFSSTSTVTNTAPVNISNGNTRIAIINQ
ncbi:hypothetical protein M3223_02535 [Paenibacillus pasadenensis]|uniref:hypothetical protein n=1 Tax=Paenibacillus pasadenensis TaxID=217090 RepID=UPI00203E4369|nr:hypothetical protein [Paenibacillus pasadenensis]MCM3746227.1 hypothetical protein [Paenibacillus pasadenensis]